MFDDLSRYVYFRLILVEYSLLISEYENKLLRTMCCNLRTHVKVISIICLIATTFGFLRLISTGKTLETFGTLEKHLEIDLVDNESAALALGIQIPGFLIGLVSGILCLMGAIKNKKCLLIPFMITQCLIILLCIGLVTFFIYRGITDLNNNNDDNSIAAFFFAMLIPLCLIVGLAIYFFVIVVKFYNELSSGIIVGQQRGIVLQPNGSPEGVLQRSGISTVYASPAIQNVNYSYQQQSAISPYPQQNYVYPNNNYGVKIQPNVAL